MSQGYSGRRITLSACLGYPGRRQTFYLVNTPGLLQVGLTTLISFLLVSACFESECDRAVSCPRLKGYPTYEILLINPG